MTGSVVNNSYQGIRDALNMAGFGERGVVTLYYVLYKQGHGAHLVQDYPLGLGVIMLLRYIGLFRNIDGIVFNTVKHQMLLFLLN